MRDTGFTEEWLAERLMKTKPRNPNGQGTKAAKRTQMVDAPLAKNKYNARKTVIGGETFDSKKEADRWLILRDRERKGEIQDLTRQIRMPLEIDGVRVCVYVCDFKYFEKDQRPFGKWIYEDAKGMRTPVYLLKKKLVKALLKIEILET